MNKTLLLSTVACVVVFSVNANASKYDWKPYVGADYVYDRADLGEEAKIFDDSFNSGSVNFGTRMYNNMGVELFYQLSDSNKAHNAGKSAKAKFNAYGLDVYGYLPIGCNETFDLLASVGIANYDIDVKGDLLAQDNDFSKVGYRFGLGAQYNITDNVSARVMGRYVYLNARELDSFDEVTAGIRYTF